MGIIARDEMVEWNQNLWEKKEKGMVQMDSSVDLQLVARKLEEEKLLAAGKVIEDILRASTSS